MQNYFFDMRKTSFLFILLISASCLAQNKVTDRPAVTITDGKIRGANEGEISVFKGIPFAAPPVGEFRWRPPQPVEKWEGELDATQFPPNCAQSGWGGQAGTGSNADSSSYS